MGLDFSHCRAHWAYSGFMRFRQKLAAAYGFVGDLESAYDDGRYHCLSKTPIWPLINHSDCEGELTVNEMRQLVPAIRSVVEKWPDDDYDKQQALQLCGGMDEAIEANEPLEFC